MGHDIWANNYDIQVKEFANLYRNEYSALPTNSQFMEWGIKESGYVSLGRRSKKNRSTLAIACARIIPGAMAEGKKLVEKDDGKKRSVQGKIRTKVLTKEAIKHKTMIDKIQQIDNHYLLTHKRIIADLTCNARQFKSERIEKKVRNYKDNHTKARRSRTYQNIGYDLTPLLSGKIRYAKMKKEHNMEQIRK